MKNKKIYLSEEKNSARLVQSYLLELGILIKVENVMPFVLDSINLIRENCNRIERNYVWLFDFKENYLKSLILKYGESNPEEVFNLDTELELSFKFRLLEDEDFRKDLLKDRVGDYQIYQPNRVNLSLLLKIDNSFQELVRITSYLCLTHRMDMKTRRLKGLYSFFDLLNDNDKRIIINKVAKTIF